jgi:hypothetical protein
MFTAQKTKKFNKAILKGIHNEFKDPASTLTKEERVELKSYAIVKALKLGKHVRN